MHLPFIIIFMIMMGCIDTIEMIHGRFANIDHPGDYPSFHSLFGRLAIWFLFAFIIATTIHRTNNRYIKILVVFPIFVLYGMHYFLISNFQYPISSSYLQLIAETNDKESSDFIKAFIFSDKIIPTLRVLLILFVSLLIYHLPLFFSLPHISQKVFFLYEAPII